MSILYVHWIEWWAMALVLKCWLVFPETGTEINCPLIWSPLSGLGYGQNLHLVSDIYWVESYMVVRRHTGPYPRKETQETAEETLPVTYVYSGPPRFTCTVAEWQTLRGLAQPWNHKGPDISPLCHRVSKAIPAGTLRFSSIMVPRLDPLRKDATHPEAC